MRVQSAAVVDEDEPTGKLVGGLAERSTLAPPVAAHTALHYQLVDGSMYDVYTRNYTPAERAHSHARAPDEIIYTGCVECVLVYGQEEVIRGTGSSAGRGEETEKDPTGKRGGKNSRERARRERLGARSASSASSHSVVV